MKYKLYAKSQYATFEQNFPTKEEALSYKCHLEYNGWTLQEWRIEVTQVEGLSHVKYH